MNNIFRSIRLFGRISQKVKQCSALRMHSASAPSNTGLSIAYDNDIAVIKMEKNDNRLNQDFFNTFHDFLNEVEGNKSVKGLITIGQGKFYSNGLDLEWMGGLPVEEMIDFMKAFTAFIKRLLFCPVPTLAAVNGHAFAGGAILAYAHDFRVMNEERGWICLNEVHLNKRFYDFMGTVLRCKIGAGLNTNDALVFGRRYTAEEAFSNKLIHSKASSSELLENSCKLLRSYLGKNGFDRSALKNVKEDTYRECLSAYDRELGNMGFSKQFMTESQLTALTKL